VVAYGMGVDSTAMLIGLSVIGMRPDLILFADVGGEKDETYAYQPIMDQFLESVGFPTITVVRYVPQDFKNWPPYHTLEENCLTNGTLPSLAFGFGSCSQKWKAAPQNQFCNAWEPARNWWAQGGRVLKAIGFDAGPADMRAAIMRGTRKIPNMNSGIRSSSGAGTENAARKKSVPPACRCRPRVRAFSARP